MRETFCTVEISKGYTPGLSDKLMFKFIPKMQSTEIFRTVLKMKNKPEDDLITSDIKKR